MTTIDRKDLVRAALTEEPRSMLEISEAAGVGLYDTETEIIGLCQGHVAVGAYDHRRERRLYRLKAVGS